MYSFYLKLTRKETGKSMSLDNKNCHSFLKSHIESVDENVDILQQLSGTKFLGDGETLMLRNLEETILESVPEELSTVPIDKINFRGDIEHTIGEYKSRRRIDDEKKALDSVFEAHSNTRPSTIFKKYLEATDGDSFGPGNLTGAGVTPYSIYLAASRVRSKHNSMEEIDDDVLKFQEQFEEDDKNEKSLIKKKVSGFVHCPSVSSCGIQIFLTDEALVRLYHVVCLVYHCTLMLQNP